MTWKHVFVVALGLATACFGAWVTIVAPGGLGGPMLISLGSSVVTGALGHAGQGLTIGRAPTAPVAGGVPSTYIPANGSMPHELR